MANPKMNGKKKRSRFGIFKLAVCLFPSRPETDDWKKPTEKTEKCPKGIKTKPAKWEKVVGSMRPLHLLDKSPTASDSTISQNESPTTEDGTLSSEDNFFCACDVSSFSTSWSSEKSGNDTMSQYDSGVSPQSSDSSMSPYGSDNLHSLVEVEEHDPDEVLARLSGDSMIDSKAEDFIAQFYQKMRLEQLNSGYRLRRAMH